MRVSGYKGIRIFGLRVSGDKGYNGIGQGVLEPLSAMESK